MTHKENKIDSTKLLDLAKAVMGTDYFDRADWDGYHLSLIVDDLHDGKEVQEEDVFEAVDELVASDRTRPLPPELRELVLYVYDVAVKHDDAQRTYQLAALYTDGRIGCQDFHRAEALFQQAAALANGRAFDALGYIYYYGRTGEPDYEQAFGFFSKSLAMNGSPSAAYMLGDMYRLGRYVKASPRAAFKCYQRAEELLGDEDEDDEMITPEADICYRLGAAYADSLGTQRDLVLALNYLQRAEQGFMQKVHAGNYFVRKMLARTIRKEQAVRLTMLEKLPRMEWTKDYEGYE